MTVNRTTLLDLPLPVTGTESNTWGDITNNGLTEYMDIAIAGMSNLTSANFTAGALTIETTEGNAAGTSISATSAQYAGFRVTSLAANSTITVGNTGTSPARSYRLINADATYNLTFKATGQTGVTLLPGQSAVVAFNGTDYVIVGTVGAGTATDNAITRFDGTTGEILQNSAATIDDTGAATFVGSVNVSGTSASAADLKLYEDTDNGTNYVAFKSPASVASNVTWTLPSADGTNGQALTTNGSGTLAFSSVTTAPGGSTTQVQYNNAGAFGGSANFVWDNSNVRLGIGTSSPVTKLDVRGTPGADYGIANIFDTTSAASGVGGVLALSGYKTTTSGAAIFAKIKGIKENATAGNEAGALTFETNSGSAYTERMRIDSSGNVGIGTSSPSTVGNGGLTLGTAAAGKSLVMYSSSDGNNGLIQFIDLNSANAFQIGGNSANIALYGYGSRPMIFYTNDTERMSINANGTIKTSSTISVGGATPSTSGAGITFPATQSASSDANTLDDYEEGTFTPTARGATTAGTTTYTNQYGYYTKIGRSVTVVILVQWSAMTGTGILTIGGLPFASANNTQNYASGAVITSDLNWTGGTMMTAFQELNTTDITLVYSSDDGPVDRQQCVNESAQLRITVTYFA